MVTFSREGKTIVTENTPMVARSRVGAGEDVDLKGAA